VTEGQVVWIRATVKSAEPGKVKVWVKGKYDSEIIIMDPADVLEELPLPPAAGAT
jgi:hypothetical protein